MDTHIERFKNALLSLDRIEALNILREATTSLQPIECTETIVVPAMEQIGDEWENGTIALSQVYMSGRICEESITTLFPSSSIEQSSQPGMAIVVLQDYHTLGKSIVISILRSAGYELLDYGAGLSVPDIIRRVCDDNIKVLLISTLMLNSALLVKEIRQELVKIDRDVKIIVGGAPFRLDTNLWRDVGADRMASQASEVVSVLKDIMKKVV